MIFVSGKTRSDYINHLLQNTLHLKLPDIFRLCTNECDHLTIYAKIKYFITYKGSFTNPNIFLEVGSERYELEDVRCTQIKDKIFDEEKLEIYKIDGVNKSVLENYKYESVININDFAVILRIWIAISCLSFNKNHLKNRISEEKPIIQHQMVKGLFSEALIKIYTVLSNYQSQIHNMEDDYFNRFIHEDIDDAMNIIMNLAGGHGYLNENISNKVYISSVIKNIYS